MDNIKCSVLTAFATPLFLISGLCQSQLKDKAAEKSLNDDQLHWQQENKGEK
jgi:hypothetical protein